MLALVTVVLRVCWLRLQWPSECAGFGYSGPQSMLALVTEALRVCWLWLHWPSEYAGFGYSGPQSMLALVTLSSYSVLVVLSSK